MNVAVDAFPLTADPPTGIPNYSRRLLMAMLKLDTKRRYYLYCKYPFEFPAHDNAVVRLGQAGGKGPNSFRNTLWLFSRGVRMMGGDGADLFFGTRQMLPPYLPGARKVLIVYDLVWHYYPETMSTYNRIVLKLLGRRSIAGADHIISVSDATTAALQEVTGVAPEKISTVYPAADGFRPLDKEASAAYIAEKYETSKNYALTVGTVEPRKNLGNLLRTFAELRGEGLQLLVTGARGWKSSPIYAEYMRLGLTEKEVKFLGYVPDEDMNRLYSGASVFLLSSIYEGFAVPPLEAMASGAPLVLSRPCVSRLAGDAGILLGPNDVRAWKDAIASVMRDGRLNEQLRRSSLERARLFSWEKSAAQVLGVFDSIA